MIQGKVVLVPFPFDDLSAVKIRPAVCSTEPIGPHRHVIVAFITSQPPAPLLATDVLLACTHRDFDRTGLRNDSAIRLHRLVTLSTRLIRRELGELTPTLLAEVRGRLVEQF